MRLLPYTKQKKKNRIFKTSKIGNGFVCPPTVHRFISSFLMQHAREREREREREQRHTSAHTSIDLVFITSRWAWQGETFLHCKTQK